MPPSEKWLGFKVIVRTFLFVNDDSAESDEFGGVALLTRTVDMPFPPSQGLRLTDELDGLDLAITEIEAYAVRETPQGRWAAFLCWAVMPDGWWKVLQALPGNPGHIDVESRFQAAMEFLEARGWTVDMCSTPGTTSAYDTLVRTLR